MFKLFFAFLLGLAVSLPALADNYVYHFRDEQGQPIPNVVFKVEVKATPPGISGSGFTVTDRNGDISFSTPVTGGSYCMLLISFTFEMIGKPGYEFNGGASGSLRCGFSSDERTIVGRRVMPDLPTVSAASYQPQLAGEMIVSAFGSALATGTQSATTGEPTLPTVLAGRRVFISGYPEGAKTACALLFVSPNQINFVTPKVAGIAVISVEDESGNTLRLTVAVLGSVAPGIFTANANGQGVPAAVIVRVRPGNIQNYEPVAVLDDQSRRFVPLALDLGPESEFVVLALFGTGWRGTRPDTEVTLKIGGIECPIEYLGAQPTLTGYDQINARLSRALIGKGEVTLDLKIGTASVFIANQVLLRFK